MNAPFTPPPPRTLTARERVDRALQRIQDIPRQVELRLEARTRAEAINALELAADGHTEAALRYHADMAALTSPGHQRTWLELAGYHAITASALQARADELRRAPESYGPTVLPFDQPRKASA